MVHVYTLECRQWVPRPIDEVFSFFSDARNLALITPPRLRFEIMEAPREMRAGVKIRYRLRPFGFPIRWTSEIARWEPPFRFCDVQVSGPYKLWEHTHRFEVSDGGSRLFDEVRYALPLGPLGQLAHFAVKRNLRDIFDYRRQRIEAMFGARA